MVDPAQSQTLGSTVTVMLLEKDSLLNDAVSQLLVVQLQCWYDGLLLGELN